MADAHMQLPVFLPGNDRNWEEIQGVASISDEGEIIIKLHHKQAAINLVKMRNEGILFAVGFDYKAAEKKHDA